jgi:hypothetical protein
MASRLTEADSLCQAPPGFIKATGRPACPRIPVEDHAQVNSDQRSPAGGRTSREGGYEVGTSPFLPDSADRIFEGSLALLCELADK